MIRNTFLKKNDFPYFFRIQFLSSNFRDPLLRRIEQEHGLTRPEFSILICLALRAGISAIDIADITRQPENTLGRGVSLLLEKGFITKEPHPADGRRYKLYLTDAGREQYQAFIHLFVEADQAMVECLTAKERADLDAILDKMCAAVRGSRAWAAA